MGSLGFTLYQLAELAGLSCAQSIHHYLRHKFPEKPSDKFKLLAICGPGSNFVFVTCRQRSRRFDSFQTPHDVQLQRFRLLPQAQRQGSLPSTSQSTVEPRPAVQNHQRPLLRPAPHTSRLRYDHRWDLWFFVCGGDSGAFPGDSDGDEQGRSSNSVHRRALRVECGRGQCEQTVHS